MRITFVLPNLSLAGGTLVVAIYANGLAAKGHHVTVLALPYSQPGLKETVRTIVRNRRLPERPETIADRFVNVDVRLVTAEEIANGSALPDADILIATWWETMEWIADATAEKGQRFHFVQGHEVFDYLPKDRVKATLRAAVPKIVVSEWLADLMREQYGASEVHLVENAVDLERFSSPPRHKNAVPTFGFINTTLPVKNVGLAIASLNAMRQELPSVNALSFGSKPLESLNWIECHPNPPQNLIPQIYARCDAWLFTSTSEGFGLPILEAMASRTPVIATPAGAAPQLVNDQNGQLVDFSVDSVVAAMRRIAGMSNDQWKALSNNAYDQARKHSWYAAIDKMEKTLCAYTNRSLN